MDRITASADGDFYTLLYGCLWIVALSIIWIFCRADPEQAVKYVVEPPEQAKPEWKGQLLEKPSLKVRTSRYRQRHRAIIDFLQVSGSSLIQCYANRTVPWSSQSLHRRWHRPRHCESERGTVEMGTDELHSAPQGVEDHAQIYTPEPGSHCAGRVSGLGQDDGGREPGRDFGDRGEIEVDNQAWRS
jgi:hypothetical protein